MIARADPVAPVEPGTCPATPDHEPDGSGPGSGLDLGVARAFLDALGAGESGVHTFQTLAEAPGCRLRPAILHGSLERLAPALAEINRRGGGLFVLVNQGDSRGRRRENIVQVRALFADFDGNPLPRRWPLEPHALVRTSPGRFHAYWFVRDVPLGMFRALQRSLAARHGSDPGVSDLSRVMRLPGSVHLKGAPFRVDIERLRGGAPYGPAQVRAAWPTVRPRRSGVRANYRGAATPSDTAAFVARAQQRVAEAPEGTRNTTLNRAAFRLGRLVGAGRLARAEATEALRGAARMCGLPDPEAERTIRSGLEAGEGIGLHEGELRASGSRTTARSPDRQNPTDPPSGSTPRRREASPCR